MIQYYETRNLKEIAKALLLDNNTSHISTEENTDLFWNESLFVAKVLLKSVQLLPFNSKILDSEITEYNKINNKQIDKRKLEENYWIRYIFNEIRIPHLVFSFSKELYLEPKKRTEYKDLQDLDELIFMGYLANKYGYLDSKQYVIKISDFDNLYNQFKNFYSKIPSKTDLITRYQLKQKDGSYEFVTSQFQHFPFINWSMIYILDYFTQESSSIEMNIQKFCIFCESFGTSDFIKCLNLKKQKDFSKAALQLLLQEDDLIITNSQQEYKKLICDLQYFSCYKNDIFLNIQDPLFSIDYKDYFLMWLSDKTKNLGFELLSQSCREVTIFPLYSLLNNTDYFENIKTLLSDKSTRPYLFFQVLYFLRSRHPEYLIDFITEENYGLAFYITFVDLCIEKLLEPKKQLLETAIVSLVKELIKLFIHQNFNTYPFNYKLFSRILLWICNYNLMNDKRSNVIRIKKEIYNYHLELLKESIKTEKNKSGYELLINNFREEKDIFFPNKHNINISQFSYLFNLLEIAKVQNNNEFLSLITDEINSLCKSNVLNSNKLFLTYEYKQIEYFDWNYFYKTLIDKNEIDKFNQQIIDAFIISNKSELSEFDMNHTNADRYKFFLKTICLAFRCSDSDYKEILERIIVHLLNYCFIDDNENRKINIFSTLYESSYLEDTNTSLFPLVVDCCNSFSPENQNTFIESVLNNGNFTLLFKSYNLILFKDGRERIEQFVKHKDFSSKIEEIYSIPDFISVVTEVTNSHLNEEFENLLFSELERIISEKAKGGYISNYTYQAELLHLYHLFKIKDIDKLKNYTFPYKDDTRRYSEYKKLLESEKQFYLAYIDLINDKYQDSYNKFVILNRNNPENLKYKSYKLYVQTYLWTSKENKKEITNSINTISDYLKENSNEKEILLFTKLKLYIQNEQIEDALYFYQTLNKDLRSDIDFASLIIEALVTKNDNQNAFKIYNEINPCFFNTNQYKEISKLLPSNLLVNTLQSEYLQILGMPSETRFCILPGIINQHNYDIGLYFVNEIKHALNKTLKKIDLVEKISENHLSEDNISDLLELEINGRLSMLNYKLDNQDRSGKSASGINSGEIDLEINFNDFSIVIEAIKYSSGATKRKEHIEKLFNYDPSRRYLYNLIYFDDTVDFNTSWNTVLSEIEHANYNTGYERIETNEIPSNNNSIKMAVSKHKGNLTYYHIMANFFYTKCP